MFYKQFNKVFTGRNILAALNAYIVVKNIESFKNRVGVNINIRIIIVQLFYP